MTDISQMSINHQAEIDALHSLSDDNAAMECIAEYVSGKCHDRDLLSGRNIDPTFVRQLFAMHGTFQNRAREKYNNVLRAQPRYYYFDGAQLINSYLGLIVLPFERLSGYNKRTILNSMQQVRFVDYNWIRQLIIQFHVNDVNNNQNEFIYSTYNYDRDYKGEWNVYNLWRHLRNAFAHSGDGTLFFFPIPDQNEGNDITHIAFYDENHYNDNDERFLAKLTVQHVYDLADHFSNLAIGVENELRHGTERTYLDILNEIHSP